MQTNRRCSRGRRALVVASCALGAGVATLSYAAWVEPRRLQVVRYRLAVDRLPAEMTGLRIAHLTDFHVGMVGTRLRTLQRAVARTIAARPDVIALTGDFTHTGTWQRGANLVAPLARAAPTYAVLGNHDHAESERATGQLVAHLANHGIRVLRNEHVVLPVHEDRAGMVIVGVNDPRLGYANLDRALDGISPRSERHRPVLLLAHVPDIVEQAPAGRFALTLAGHTHGGQLRFSPFHRFTPLEIPMIVGDLESSYPRGTYVVNGNPLFVSNGLGVSGVPFRFLAPPQIAIFELSPSIDESRNRDDVARYFTELPRQSPAIGVGRGRLSGIGNELCREIGSTRRRSNPPPS